MYPCGLLDGCSVPFRPDALSGNLNLPSFIIGNPSSNFYVVFGRFPAELGPETRSNGSGSKNGAERTQN